MGIMKRKVLLIFSLTLLVLLTGCTAKGSESTTEQNEKVYKWRLVTHQIPGTTRYEGTIKEFVETVEKSSNGRLIIEPYGGGELFPTTDTLDMVKNNVVEMSAIYSSYWTGKDPVFALAAATFPGDPISDFSEHYYRTLKLEPIITDTFEKLGVKSLGSFDWGPPEILMSKVPIRSIDDFKGKNIRATGIASMYYGALGASAVALSAPEIYTGLQLGTVDAAEYNDYLVNKEMGFHEVTKYIIDPALHTGASIDKELIVNPESWAELPEDLQNIVIAARDQARFNSAIAYGTESEKSKQEWIDHGVEIIRLPEEDIEKMRKIGFDLLNDYKEKSPASKEYIEEYAKLLAELGYEKEAKQLGFTK